MNSIKFRAWDGRNEQLAYSDREDCFYIDKKGAFFMYAVPKSESGLITEYYKSYDLMQFIGLKDGDNNELYQGDIIEDHIGIGVIVWCDKNCSFKVSYRKGNMGKWFLDYTDNELKTILRIGNVYEDKGLLND